MSTEVRMLRASTITGMLLLLLGLAQGSSRSTSRQDAYGFAPDGRAVKRLDIDADSRPVAAVVLVFLATDCPISNRYMPELKRLAEEFAGSPVAFWMVYPNAGETRESVLRHEALFDASNGAHVLLHPSGRLMALTRAAITPQSAVLVSERGGDLKLAYSGRIDDRYLDIGRERPQATRHDLELAIRAVLKHEAVAPAGGPPVGCGIVSEAMLHGGAGK